MLRLLIARPHRSWLTRPLPEGEAMGGTTVIVGEWRIALVLRAGTAFVSDARCPGADEPLSWSYGCERDNWALAEGSVVVEPVQLLSRGERAQLLEVLQELEVEEPEHMAPFGPPVEAMARAAARDPKTKGKGRGKAGRNHCAWSNPWPSADPAIARRGAAA